jgi:hypothetical protein
MDGTEKMDESPLSSGLFTPTSPTLPQNWGERDMDKEMERVASRDENLVRTKSAVSIAETLSLPRELLFVSVICMAQFMTRKYTLHPLINDLTLTITI